MKVAYESHVNCTLVTRKSYLIRLIHFFLVWVPDKVKPFSWSEGMRLANEIGCVHIKEKHGFFPLLSFENPDPVEMTLLAPFCQIITVDLPFAKLLDL